MLEMSCVFSLQSEHLVLTYTVSNTGDKDVYLLNRIPRFEAGFSLDPNNIYIRFDEAKIHLYKGPARIPEGVSPTEPIAVHITVLRSQGQLSEQVTIDLPVQEHEAYMVRSPVTARTEGEAEGVFFSLAYLVRPPGAEERWTTFEGERVLLFKNPPGALPEAGVLTCPVEETTVPVVFVSNVR